MYYLEMNSDGIVKMKHHNLSCMLNILCYRLQCSSSSNC